MFYDEGEATKLWTLALVHQPNSNFLGKISMATPKARPYIFDPETFRCSLSIGCSWICRFDIKYDGDYQIIGFSFYRGEKGRIRSTGLGKGTPLTDAEVENWKFGRTLTAAWTCSNLHRSGSRSGRRAIRSR